MPPVNCLLRLFKDRATHTHTIAAMPTLASARYGKDNVRVYKVHRDEKTGVQSVTEMTVCCLLEGQIETS